MKGPTQPCGLCKQPVDLKRDRWTRRRVGGRWKVVCAPCAKVLDGQKELDLELAIGFGVA